MRLRTQIEIILIAVVTGWLCFFAVAPGAFADQAFPSAQPAAHRGVSSSDASDLDAVAAIKQSIDQARAGATGTLPVLVPENAAASQFLQSGRPAPGKQEEPGAAQAKKFKVDISGFRYLKFRKYGSTGSQNSFLSRNGLMVYGSRIEQGSNLQFKASRDKLKLEGIINEMPMQEREMVFNVSSSLYSATFGDFTSKFAGGELATLNKKITGMEFGYKTKKLEMQLVTSQSKSETRTISFNGNDTHGPYDLKTFEILPGSMTVRLNGIPMSPDKFDVDYYAGQINFCTTRPPLDCVNIKTSDTVQVDYEQKLLLSLTGGNIQGLSATWKPSKNFNIGVANLVEQANKSSQRVRRNTTDYFTGKSLIDQPGQEDTIMLKPGGDKFQFQGRGLVFMVKNTETVTINEHPLQRNTDYTIAYDGYMRGIITLAAIPAASDNISVSYSLYDQAFVNISADEDLIDAGDGSNIFYLSKYTVFPGIETVRYCKDEICSIGASDLLLQGANRDYTIDETNNALMIVNILKRPNAALHTFIRITYYYVPTDSPTASRYDHTVQNIFGKYSFGKNTSLGFEYATSLSDISKTSVQIMNEVLIPAGAPLTCPTAANPPAECIRQLTHDNIEEDSEAIKLNTQSTSLMRGAQYLIDSSAGRIVFTGGVTIPQNAVVYASYRFLPPIDLGLTNGKALRFKAATKIRNASINVSQNTTDTTFAPIGGNTSLETNHLDYSIDLPITKNIHVTNTRARYKTAQDIFNIFSTANTLQQTSVSFSDISLFKTINYTFGSDAAADNRPIHDIDTGRKNRALDVEVGIPIRKHEATIAYSVSSEKFNDSTAKTDNTNSGKNGLRFSYSPMAQLQLEMTTSAETVTSSGVSDPFSTRTLSRNVALTWLPIKLITLSANIDSQKQSDTRADAAASAGGVNSSSIRLTTMPFGRFRAFSYTRTQQDRPSDFTGGSRNDVQNLTFTISASKSISLTPELTTSKSSSPGVSAKTDMKSLKAEYLPPHKKFEAVIIKNNSSTSSRSAFEQNGRSSSSRISLDTKYKFSKAANFIYRFDSGSNSASGTPISTSDKRHVFQYNFKAGDKLQLKTQYSLYGTTSNTSALERNLQFTSDYKISKILTWTLEYDLNKYTSSQQSTDNYAGNILETTLNLKF